MGKNCQSGGETGISYNDEDETAEPVLGTPYPAGHGHFVSPRWVGKPFGMRMPITQIMQSQPIKRIDFRLGHAAARRMRIARPLIAFLWSSHLLDNDFTPFDASEYLPSGFLLPKAGLTIALEMLNYSRH